MTSFRFDANGNKVVDWYKRFEEEMEAMRPMRYPWEEAPAADYVREPHPASTPEYSDPHRTIHVGANGIGDDEPDWTRWGVVACVASAVLVGVAIGWGIWG